MQRLFISVAIALLAVSCSGTSVDISEVPKLPPVTAEDLNVLLDGSTTPVVVNVWASWCVPCRSEAPLLEKAASSTGEDVFFVGLNVRDDQEGARGFIAEFFPDAPIEHLFDPDGGIPLELGGTRGVPLTFFYATGGELITVHNGVIDERTLALQIDEIMSR
ncbi:MAG: TlpA family protein disulfide reductase [bacterium]|nr:TlpA family protein disulfide reductase [bacterium]MCP4968845.1 TlpA family protein disulfide reductase [bacterium]